MKRYVLHPGYVYSRNDGDRHWIGPTELAALYGVRLLDCIIVNHRVYAGVVERAEPSMIHLYPRESGDYSLPT